MCKKEWNSEPSEKRKMFCGKSYCSCLINALGNLLIQNKKSTPVGWVDEWKFLALSE